MSKVKNLWGGRFTSAADQKFVEFNRSFNFDLRLFAFDVRASAAHAESLRQIGVLTDAEAKAIDDGLKLILKKAVEDADFFFDSNAEDVHSFIENKLVEIAGEAGRKLHTGRSRNDQVATAFRLWTRDATDDLIENLRQTQSALLDLAEQNITVILPGYTHLQRAQPILFAHWCLAYFEMLRRDGERFSDCRKRTNVCPLGSAALAGTAYPVNRELTANELAFDSITRNSLDAVSDRDFAVEFAHAASLTMVHLSRLAEDIILYATTEFNFFELSDAISTGSSLMPQKKNPDSMELVRGKAGRVFGHLTTLLTVLKALPLAYNKDLQEDKEAVFGVFDTVRDCLQITATVLRNLKVNREKTKIAAAQGYLNATELADYLVRQGVAFREAHEITGKIVLLAIEKNVELEKLALSELQVFSSKIETDVFAALSLNQTVNSKNTVGGTNPERVATALHEARLYLTSLLKN